MKQFNLRILSLLLIAALVGLGFAQDEVVIGWSGAITGPTSDAGQFVVQGVEDYCAYANAQDLIPDYQLTCLTADDQYDNNNTLRNFLSFLDEGMDAFISYGTGGTLQLKVNAVEEQMPVVSASLHIGVIDPPDSAYNFLPITSYSEQVVALLEWIAENHQGDAAPKVALLLHPSAFGRAPVEDAQAAAEALGIEIVEIIEHGDGTDYTAILQRWNNSGVQYVVTQTVQSPVAAMLNTAEALGLKETMTFMGAHYTGGSTLVSIAGDAAEGFLWATSYYMGHEDTPGMELVRQIGEQNGRPEESILDVNYTSGMLQTAIFVEAARRAAEAGEEVNSESIYQQLLMMNEEGNGVFEQGFAVGPVSYSETDHVGVDALRLLEAQDGQFMPITEPFQSELFREVHGE